jgi:ABC-2 type transport system permease protein
MISKSLLLPFWWTAKNRFLPTGRLSLKAAALLLFSLGLCVVLYLISYRVVGYFHRQNELGIILSLKIFQMSWIILFAMLIFSCMVSAVSSLFLSQDNEIICAAPVSPADIFFLRYTTTTIYTSWMMVIFSLPVYFAYGRVFNADFPYWPLMLAGVVATAATANCIGLLITIPLVNLFPARRTKDIIVYLFLCFGLFFYIIFRLMRPEDMLNPDQFSQFIDYLSSISRPTGPYLPAGWAANLLSLYLLDHEIDWLLLALILITPPALFILGEWAMQRWFFPAYSKAQESFGGYRRFITKTKRLHAWYWILLKEMKTFLRDSAEWAQLFMIGALVVVYLYNFKLLPVKRSPFAVDFITNIISFLNIGLTGFIITSLAARFVFPSIGAEGGAFYIIQKAPLSVRRFLLYKCGFYAIPFTVLSLFLVVTSDHLLHINGPMWWISVTVSTLITWTVIGLALGFGAIYADFKAENRAAALGGMGAILFLFTAMTFEFMVLAIGSIPAYRLTAASISHRLPQTADMLFLVVWLVGSFLSALALAVFFLKRGIKRLTEAA